MIVCWGRNGRFSWPRLGLFIIIADVEFSLDDIQVTTACFAFFQSTSNSVKIIETGMFSIGHLMLTALHLVQFTLAYILMLIVMTYNTWLCLATVLGSTVGYFLFGWRKNAIVDVSDHCH